MAWKIIEKFVFYLGLGLLPSTSWKIPWCHCQQNYDDWCVCREYTLVGKNGGKTGGSACTSTLGSINLYSVCKPGLAQFIKGRERGESTPVPTDSLLIDNGHDRMPCPSQILESELSKWSSAFYMPVTYLNRYIYVCVFYCRISSSFKILPFCIVNLTQSFGMTSIISFIFLNIVLFRPCFNAYVWIGE